jgi:hypothetical protein
LYFIQKKPIKVKDLSLNRFFADGLQGRLLMLSVQAIADKSEFLHQPRSTAKEKSRSLPEAANGQ